MVEQLSRHFFGLLEAFMSWSLYVAATVLPKLPRPVREFILPNMRMPPIENDESKVQLERLGHVIVEHADLAKFRQFAKDFGMVEEKVEKDRVYYRGYGIDPFLYVAQQSKIGKSRFMGPAFVARSQKDFDKAAALPGARLGSLADAPGGGQIVTIERSDETYIHVIFGQTERSCGQKEEPSATHEHVGPMNTPFNKLRRGRCLVVLINFLVC
jgi:hypothetical protein